MKTKLIEITDEHAIEVAKILTHDKVKGDTEYIVRASKNDVGELVDHRYIIYVGVGHDEIVDISRFTLLNGFPKISQIIKAIDFLRAKGYEDPV